jgi:hypothetical protein
MKSIKFMKHGVSGGGMPPPLVGVGPTARMGATSYKSYRPSAFGFFRLSNFERCRQQTRRGRP